MRIVLTIWLLLPLLCSGATITVRTDGSDSNSGIGNSSGESFLTLKKACDTAGNGDTIIVTPGTYQQFASYNIATANNLTIRGTNAFLEGLGLYIGATNCVADGLQFTNVTDNFKVGAAIVLATNAHNTVIKNCTMRDSTDKHGIWMLLADNQTPRVLSGPFASAHDCVFTNNVFTNIFGGQCHFISGSNNLVVGSQMFRIRSGDGFIFHGCSNIFRNCYIWSGDNPLGGLHPDIMQTYGTDGNNDAADAPTFGNIFERCQFWDWQGALGQMTVDESFTNSWTLRVDGPLVRNCLYVRCGPTNGSISSLDCPNTRFVNNTFISCGTFPDSSGEVLNFVYYATNVLTPTWRGQATNSLVFNNAFIGCGRSSSGGWYTKEYSSFTPTATDLFTNYNYVVNWNGSAFGTKSVFSEANGINTGADPLLVSFPSNNFRPMLGSPLINVGTNTSPWLSLDIEGFTRPFGGSYDIGAYEFDPDLVMFFDFDESTTSRILDVTGYGHNALRWDSTNWLQTATSVNGSLASLGTIVSQVPDNSYNYSWYGGITNLGGSGGISKITNGTFAAWVQMGTTGERWDTILDTGEPPSAALTPGSATNSWNVHYGYPDLREATVTNFVFVSYGTNTANDLPGPALQLGWPALLRDGTTWGHIAATWTGGGNVTLYFNGQPCLTNALNSPWLSVSTSPANPWVGLSIQTHGGTVQWGDSDIYPNYGALKGKLDDVKLYRRTLSASEISLLAGSTLSAGGSGGDAGTTLTPYVASRSKLKGINLRP